MNKSKFDEFLDKQSEKQKESKEINWKKNKDDWKQSLSDFYTEVESYLEDYVKNKKITYDFTSKTIIEDHIGSYNVKVLNINIGEHKVRLDPIGTLLIGAKGRVDLVGTNGTVKFVLINKNASGSPFKFKIFIGGEEVDKKEEKPEVAPEWVWKIATPPPQITYIDFKKETFFDSLMEVING